MTLTIDDLRQVCTSGHGPLRLVERGDAFDATLDGHSATVAIDGDTIRVTGTAEAEWPEATPDLDPTGRVYAELGQLVLSRPELCTIAAAPADGVTVTMWIDQASSGVHDLAIAVRNTAILAQVGGLSVDQVRFDIAAEQDLYEQTKAAISAAERAGAILEEIEEEPEDVAEDEFDVDTEAARPALGLVEPIPEPTVPAAAPRPAAPPAPMKPAGPPPPAGPAAQVGVATDLVASDRSVVARVEPGTWYEIADERDGWMALRADGKIGWLPATAITQRRT